MSEKQTELKQIASHILAGMLANSHIYAMVSDEEGQGQQEQILIDAAIGMAEQLIEKAEKRVAQFTESRG